MDIQQHLDKIELNQEQFESKIIASIEGAIENKSAYGDVELEWLGGDKLKRLASHPVTSYMIFSPDNPTNIQNTVSQIYRKISDKYWNERKIGLFFGPKDGGSNVSIEDTNNEELMKEYVELNKDNREEILKRCLMILAGVNKDEKNSVDLAGVSMKVIHWPFVMRSVSDELEPHGKIVMDDGRFMVINTN